MQYVTFMGMYVPVVYVVAVLGVGMVCMVILSVSDKILVRQENKEYKVMSDKEGMEYEVVHKDILVIHEHETDKEAYDRLGAHAYHDYVRDYNEDM